LPLYQHDKLLKTLEHLLFHW